MKEKPDKATLERLYISEKKSSAEIAPLYGVNSRTIRSWLTKVGIKLLGNSHLRKGKSAVWNIGIERSPSWRAKQRESHLGKLPHNKGVGSRKFACEVCGKDVFDKPYRKKRTCSKACKDQLSHIYSGERHWNWRGGPTTWKNRPTGRKRLPEKGHGTYASYHRGCRCCECKDANKTYARLHRNTSEEARQKTRDRAKKWQLDNPERYATIQKKNRARRRGAPGDFTADDLVKILKAQKHKCAYCKTSIRSRKNRHLDHIKPLSKGGTNHLSNLQFCCVFCNSSKHARDPLDYARSRGLIC